MHLLTFNKDIIELNYSIHRIHFLEANFSLKCGSLSDVTLNPFDSRNVRKFYHIIFAAA